MQSIILHSHPGGPIPWKVAIILEDLNLPYETHFVSFKDVKNEPFIYLNPNGRLPAIEDPTTKESLFRNPVRYYIGPVAKYQTKAWLHFQAGWFHRAAPERILTAIERYGNEIRRGTGVGDKCTYADLCFLPWQRWAPRYATDAENLELIFADGSGY
ncbi:hypothetical protein BDV23DRAFT_170563 [Aspergillus alliaceus]|uniref:GST N-terminal domain-containing protein n=1 Tax=Petromyces alliaceus TaxID=209559 RepID=A0A5N7CGL5_PETAA|nr:hypothetical protein BDV23DRAFT_170563 [Aspergillus alliaceus]